eukprot:scaffold115_cov304-Prasinococcus_capsulatus_cf.AAC.10
MGAELEPARSGLEEESAPPEASVPGPAAPRGHEYAAPAQRACQKPGVRLRCALVSRIGRRSSPALAFCRVPRHSSEHELLFRHWRRSTTRHCKGLQRSAQQNRWTVEKESYGYVRGHGILRQRSG